MLLYELGLHSLEWQQEHLISEPSSGSGNESKTTVPSVGTSKGYLQSLCLTGHSTFSPTVWMEAVALVLSGRQSLAQQRLSAELPEWKIALCASTELLALWQHQEICLLSPRDNYSQPFALWRSPSDALPHCRHLAWNQDDTLLVAAMSDGRIHILDSRGRLLHAVPPHVWLKLEGELPAQSSSASASFTISAPAPSTIISLAWREVDGGRAVTSELLLLCGDATLRRLSVPAAEERGAKAAPSPVPPLQLTNYHGLIAALAYDQVTGLLAVGGGGGATSAQAQLMLAKRSPDAEPLNLPGLSLWALFDKPPFALFIFSTTLTIRHAPSGWVPSCARMWLRRAKASVWGGGVPHCLAFSTGAGYLAVLTLQGELTVWSTGVG